MDRQALVQEVVKDSAVQQKELAADAGVHPDTLLSWMRGRREPTADGLLKLAAGLDKRPEKLKAAAARVRTSLTSPPP